MLPCVSSYPHHTTIPLVQKIVKLQQQFWSSLQTRHIFCAGWILTACRPLDLSSAAAWDTSQRTSQGLHLLPFLFLLSDENNIAPRASAPATPAAMSSPVPRVSSPSLSLPPSPSSPPLPPSPSQPLLDPMKEERDPRLMAILPHISQ
jgi:hypothetical protein